LKTTVKHSKTNLYAVEVQMNVLIKNCILIVVVEVLFYIMFSPLKAGRRKQPIQQWTRKFWVSFIWVSPMHATPQDVRAYYLGNSTQIVNIIIGRQVFEWKLHISFQKNLIYSILSSSEKLIKTKIHFTSNSISLVLVFARL